jgi:hypothetical protein
MDEERDGPGAGVTDDLFLFRVAAAAWTDLSGRAQGPAPPQRAYHGLAAARGAIYVVGGFGSLGAHGRGGRLD